MNFILKSELNYIENIIILEEITMKCEYVQNTLRMINMYSVFEN